MAAAGSGITLGFLKYVLGFDSLAFEQGIGDAQKRMKKAQRDIEKHAQKIAGIGSALSVGITAPLAGFGALAVKEAQEATQAMAQVNAALTSMGPKAGRTAEQLKAAADAMELGSLAEGDEILRKVTANLLTFGNISGTAFDKAQQAALDLSARMGKDLQSSAILVGKALNDPIKGMASLGRAGIQFSVDQKAAISAMVETGNVAGAQAIILGEFQKQFGGAAQAAQNTDPLNQANDSFKQMAETVGNALLPLIPIFTEAVVAVTGAFGSLSPETQKWVIIIGAAAAALGPLLLAVGTMVSLFGTALPALVAAKASLVAVGVAAGGGAAGLGAMAIAVGTIVAPFALAAAAVYGLIKYGPEIVSFGAKTRVAFDAAVASAKALYEGVKTWVLDKLNAVWNGVKAKIDAVKGWFFGLYDAVVGNSYIPDMVDGIRDHMARLDAVMVQPVVAATGKADQAFQQLQQSVAGLLGRLFPDAARENQFQEELRLLKEYADKAKWSVEQLDEAVRRLREEYVPGAGPTLAGADDPLIELETWAGDLEGVLVRPAENAANRTTEAFAHMAEGIVGSIGGVIQSIKGKDWLGALGGVLGIVQQVATAIGRIKGGNMGSGGFGGFRAAGGPTVPGKSYVVGEDGPEWFTPGRSGYVHPSGSGGNSRIQVVPSPYFDLVVDGRAAGVAAPMAGQAAVSGSVGAQRAIAIRQQRRLP